MKYYIIIFIFSYLITGELMAKEHTKNVLGSKLEICCTKPMTGFFRDGYCSTNQFDHGTHVVCAIMTDEFLAFTKSRGNDLSTPSSASNFPGLKAGDLWCLCATRWKEAYDAGFAPGVKLEATNIKALELISLDSLKEKAQHIAPLPVNILGETMLNNNVYQFHFKHINEQKELPLAEFKGKVILIVNTASKCGFTGQYAPLEALYQKFKAQGLVIIGIPSNDFGGQEPGSPEEIASFCQLNYGVTFPLTAKEIVSGKEAHPFYLWATNKLGLGSAPHWNFHKYLVNRKGELVDFFLPITAPDSKNIIQKIEQYLQETE
jgi:glutathione peroxidase